ncbi:MAG: DegT/DnrJ/EryC1/StrS family aminotransferase, partial [Deltaproteobacteria bacterium]|nr:DegT/DnrJ/EryC1/StrS family aminotransferase [Deltaproteobacteria bacterium]
ALQSYGIGPGDAVLTTPFTFISTAEVISLVGATPVFVDIDPKTFNIDSDKLEQAIRAFKEGNPEFYPLPNISNLSQLNLKAIIPVDLFGLPADYDRINEIARKHGLFVIEDGAQSFGAEYKGKKACSVADIACTSFFPAKPLGCYGDGGMCFTDDDHLAELMRSFRVHGKGSHKYDNVRIGMNGRLDTIQAAILLAKFDIFPEEIHLRQQAAQNYTELISKCSSLATPIIPDGFKSAWAQYSLLAENEHHRETVQTRLKEKGIPTAIYYPNPLHRQTAFTFLDYKEGDFSVSEECARRIFSLPMHPYLTEKEQQQVLEMLSDINK